MLYSEAMNAMVQDTELGPPRYQISMRQQVHKLFNTKRTIKVMILFKYLGGHIS